MVLVKVPAGNCQKLNSPCCIPPLGHAASALLLDLTRWSFPSTNAHGGYRILQEGTFWDAVPKELCKTWENEIDRRRGTSEYGAHLLLCNTTSGKKVTAF